MGECEERFIRKITPDKDKIESIAGTAINRRKIHPITDNHS